MRSGATPGVLYRIWTALGSTFKRALLGKSGYDYMEQFPGRYTCWGNAIAAQQGYTKQLAQPAPAPDYEPVHGWTKRQLDDYLARNPGYRATYKAEMLKRSCEAAPEVSASPNKPQTGATPIEDQPTHRRAVMDSFRPDQVVCLTTAPNPAQAHIWGNALQEEGILCRIVGDYLDAGIGDISGVQAEIWVTREELIQAQNVLQRCSQSEVDPPEDQHETDRSLSCLTTENEA